MFADGFKRVPHGETAVEPPQNPLRTPLVLCAFSQAYKTATPDQGSRDLLYSGFLYPGRLYKGSAIHPSSCLLKANGHEPERTIEMKTIKTRNDMRSTFTYISSTGEKKTLRPGIDPDTGELITEEYIKRLHQMDDNEVYNNVKNTRPPIQKWERLILEAWKKDHPDMDLPTRTHISIDNTGEDDEGNERDSDKRLLAKASMAASEAESPMVERLHEVVAMLRPDQQELYRRVVIEEESMEDIAVELGVVSSAVRQRMCTVKRTISPTVW